MGYNFASNNKSDFLFMQKRIDFFYTLKISRRIRVQWVGVYTVIKQFERMLEDESG